MGEGATPLRREASTYMYIGKYFPFMLYRTCTVVHLLLYGINLRGYRAELMGSVGSLPLFLYIVFTCTVGPQASPELENPVSQFFGHLAGRDVEKACVWIQICTRLIRIRKRNFDGYWIRDGDFGEPF